MGIFDRKRSKWSDFFDEFYRMDEMIEGMEKDFEETLKEFEEIGKDSKVRKYGPYVYGFSMSVGPDGKPVIKEFGNVKADVNGKPSLQYSREPLVDVFDEKGQVKVLAELPGVDKNEINLDTTGKTLTISTADKKYHKEVELPVEVNPDDVKASYNNGVLEVIMKRKELREEGKKRIRIN